jgi:hypothetical protein
MGAGGKRWQDFGRKGFGYRAIPKIGADGGRKSGLVLSDHLLQSTQRGLPLRGAGHGCRIEGAPLPVQRRLQAELMPLRPPNRLIHVQFSVFSFQFSFISFLGAAITLWKLATEN